MTGYDILGNIAILKFPNGASKKEKDKEAKRVLQEHGNIKTVLEKVEKVHGRLRTIKTKYLAGVKTKEALHKENNCWFKLNVESCYFSPRLSGERLEIAKLVNRKEKVLVLFSGVAPFGIVIAKISGARVVCVELGRECCKYAKENVKINKLENIEILQGDVKRIKLKEKFDRILMPRPQLKDSFLKYAFKFAKKGTIFHYYDFRTQEEFDAGKTQKIIIEEVKREKKKIEILRVKMCGDLAPYKFRVRVDFKIL